jgi:surfactin synthase thioesterase subunit
VLHLLVHARAEAGSASLAEIAPTVQCDPGDYAGTDDVEAPVEVADEWRLHTRATFGLRTFRGGHFFLRTHHREILADIGRHLHPVVPATPA